MKKRRIKILCQPFPDLEQEVEMRKDLIMLQLSTLEGKKYNMIFKRRLRYSEVYEYSLFEISEVKDED